jgi:hypothetical protein
VQEQTKTATCACGAVNVTARGSPIVVNACSCRDCQRRSGSAFTYTAFYASADVTASGALKSFRNVSESGRARDTLFCPSCGVTMLTKLEVFPQATGVAVGTLADNTFDAPKTFYWAKHKHGWYSLNTPVSEKPEQ